MRGRSRGLITAAIVTGAAFAFPALLPPLAAAAGPAIDGFIPQRYNISLSWAPSTRTLSGTSTITVKNAGPAALTRVWVRLFPNSIASNGASDCANARDHVTSVSGATVGAYQQMCSAVALDLPAAVGPGALATFSVSTSFKVPRNADWVNQGVDDIASAWPTVALHDDRGLHLEPYPDDGEAEYNVAADWHTVVRVPDTVKVAMSGAESSVSAGGFTTYSSTAHVRDIAMVFGPISTTSTTVGGVTLRIVSGAAYDARARANALALLVQSFTAYQQWYGGYALGDLDVVIGDYDYGGTEYPGLVLSNPDLATISHEVAHQWFYAIVGNDQYDDPWLDESFATWNEQQFDRYYKCDPANPLNNSKKGLAVGMDWWDGRPNAYDDVIYRGGYCALTRLERDIGHAQFMTVLRNYVSDFHDQVARTGDFLDEVRRVAPSYDVDAWARLVKLQ